MIDMANKKLTQLLKMQKAHLKRELQLLKMMKGLSDAETKQYCKWFYASQEAQKILDELIQYGSVGQAMIRLFHTLKESTEDQSPSQKLSTNYEGGEKLCRYAYENRNEKAIPENTHELKGKAGPAGGRR